LSAEPDGEAGRDSYARARTIRVVGALHVGTSGWAYAKWQGIFYPDDWPRNRDLEYYARIFDSVEVNNTFYRLPTPAQLDTWRRRTPDGFRFALKGSRFVTHRKRLSDAALHVPLLVDRLPALREKAGVLLWQLPPGWEFDEARLREFLETLPDSPPSAMEFRDPTWLNTTTRRLLARFGVGFVVHDHAQLTTPAWVTAPFVYLRFHGPRGDYHGSYDRAALATWADRAGRWLDRGSDVWAYFNNDADGRAPFDAQTFRELVSPGATLARARVGFEAQAHESTGDVDTFA
jgi:uncharacterized protein YecE (DUF72 family)